MLLPVAKKLAYCPKVPPLSNHYRRGTKAADVLPSMGGLGGGDPKTTARAAASVDGASATTHSEDQQHLEKQNRLCLRRPLNHVAIQEGARLSVQKDDQSRRIGSSILLSERTKDRHLYVVEGHSPCRLVLMHGCDV